MKAQKTAPKVIINQYAKTNYFKIADFSYSAAKSAVSWKRPYDCPDGARESMRLNVHRIAGWVSIITKEGFTTEKGKWSGKETILTLHHTEALALRDFLNASLPESTEG